jgi:hypothetical protein
MTLSSKSFKAGESSFGIFYPTGYVLSVFQDGAQADEAVAALARAGFSSDDIVPGSGSDMLALSQELHAMHGLLIAFERFLSQRLGDESNAEDELVVLAGAGSAFLAVYAPDDAATARVVDATKTLDPVVLRKFDRLTYTDLR